MFKIYTDGGSRGNPGPAGAGGVIKSPLDSTLIELSEFLGIQTNNYAEYTAMLLTLKRAIELGIDKLEAFTDSKLIVEQLNGNWQVKSETLKPIYDEIQDLLPNFKTITFAHIPRKLNAHADSLANKAMDTFEVEILTNSTLTKLTLNDT